MRVPCRKTPPKFCGVECKREHGRKRAVRGPFKCQLCERVFSPKYRLPRKRALLYCSKVCAGKSKWMEADPAPDLVTLTELVRKIIRAAGRYVGPEEAIRTVGKMIGKGRKSFIGIGVPEINRQEGFYPPPASVFEGHVFEILKQLFPGEKIERRWWFDDCRSPRNALLYFDFFVESKGLLIEADGNQHKPGSSWSSDYYRSCDKVKDRYVAKSKTLRLARVPYAQRIGRDEVEEAIARALDREVKPLAQKIEFKHGRFSKRSVELEKLLPEVRELVEGGKTNDEIAQALGHELTAAAVALLLNRHGIKRSAEVRSAIMLRQHRARKKPE